MSAAQIQAYRNVQKPTMSDREIDAYALTQSALKLRECKENWDMPELERIGRLFEALRMNSLLWSIFQAELTMEGNPLPLQLRQDILTLSLFIDKRTKEVMCFPEPEKLNILININLNIAAGLRSAAPATETEQVFLKAEAC